MAVCLLGMHRSGTSMVARLLQRCDVYLGEEEDLGAPAPDNPRGFAENRHFVEINDAVLARLNGGWDAPPDYGPQWQDLPELDDLRYQALSLIETMAVHPVWGWKDPRTTLTLPFWQKLIPDLHVLVCVRHPLAVALSLHARNFSSVASGVRLWRRYYEILNGSVPPAQRVVTHYDRYFDRPLAELFRVLGALGLPRNQRMLEAAVAEVEPTIRHHNAAALGEPQGRLEDELLGLYLSLCAEADGVGGPLPATPALKDMGAKIQVAATATIEARETAAPRGHPIVENGDQPVASIIIPTHNGVDFTRLCLESIFVGTAGPPFEVIVVDNASTDPTVGYLEWYATREPRLRVVRNDSNVGFAAAVNRGIANARGQFIVVANNDTIVTAGWLPGLLDPLAEPTVGLVGPVTNSSGNESCIAVTYSDPSEIEAFARRHARQHAGKRRELAMMPLFCAAMRRDVVERVGLLDTRFGLGMFEDDDYALRLRLAGYKLLCVEDVFVHHWGSVSFRQLGSREYLALFHDNRRLFEEKWRAAWRPPVPRRELWPAKAAEVLESNLWLSEMSAEQSSELTRLQGEVVARARRETALEQMAEEHRRRAQEETRRIEELTHRTEELERQREELARRAEQSLREAAVLAERGQALEGNLARLTDDLQDRQETMRRIVNSAAWAVAVALYHLHERLAPAGSRRDRLWQRVRKGLRVWRQHGLRALFERLHIYVDRHRPPTEGARADRWRTASDRTRRTVNAPSETRYGVQGLVSVVLPVYNQSEFLRAAIESALGQTYADFELIIVNDGSTDNVEEILDDYVGRPRVRILTQENQTLSNALNNGFAFAGGEFWTWTSADNLMHPHHLARMVEFLRSGQDVAMVYADYEAIDDRSRPLTDVAFRPHNRRNPRSPEIHLPRDTAQLNLVADNFIGGCFMYRGSVGLVVGEYAPWLGVEDYDYWMRVNAQFLISHLGTDEMLYRYRVHANTLNARAAELGIGERVAKLMATEQQRATFFGRPWTIFADAASRQWLEKEDVTPHTVVALEDFEPDNPWPSKAVLVVSGPALAGVARLTSRGRPYTVAWFEGDPDLAFRQSSQIRSSVDLCFAADNATADILSVLHPRVLRVAPGGVLVREAVASANDHAFFASCVPEESRQRRLPTAYRPHQRPLNIMLQVDSFTQGGLEQVVLDIATLLDPSRYHVELLILGATGRAWQEAQRLGVTTVALPSTPNDDDYERILRERRIDVVHAHYSIAGAAVAARLGVPFVQTVHNTYVWLPPERVAALAAADAHTTAYTCVSPIVAHYAHLRLGLPAAKMVVVPNGIDTRRFAQPRPQEERRRLRETLGITPEDVVFLNVASIYAPKGQKFLVRALARIGAACPNAQLVLLGGELDKGYAEEVRNTVREHDLEERVVFAGYHEDAGAFFAMADAFVLPSLWEGWSLALAEAVAAGLPVVATDVGAAREVVQSTGAGHVIAPPFESITALSYDNLLRVERADNPEFVEQLGEAMAAVYGNPRRVELPAAALARLDCSRSSAVYGELYGWLAQGGSPVTARAWLWPTTAALGAAEPADLGAPAARESDAPAAKPSLGGIARAESAVEAAQFCGDQFRGADYYRLAEPDMDRQWNTLIWPMIKGLDFTCVVDLAAGHGRNTEKLRQHAETVWVVDITEENLEACRRRFGNDPRIAYLRTNGVSLAGILDSSVTLVYSFDSMVHFDSDIVRAYLREFARVLKPGGCGFCHHSNYAGSPFGSFTESPHWRNFMTRELFAHYCHKEGLTVLDAKVIDWTIPSLDCCTVFQKGRAASEE